jgi:hypothetical protein
MQPLAGHFFAYLLLLHGACAGFGLLCLLVPQARAVAVHLVLVPLFSLLTFARLSPALDLLAPLPILFGSDSAQIGVGSFFFENVCRSYFMASGGFAGYLLGVSINKAAGLGAIETRSVSRVFLRVSIFFWMAFLTLLVSALHPMLADSRSFGRLLRQEAHATAKGEKFCIIGPLLTPVRSFEDIDFWMLAAESVKFELGLPNRVTESSSGSGLGTIRRRHIHLGILVGDKGYHWSFRQRKFVKNHLYFFFNSRNRFAEPQANCPVGHPHRGLDQRARALYRLDKPVLRSR